MRTATLLILCVDVLIALALCAVASACDSDKGYSCPSTTALLASCEVDRQLCASTAETIWEYVECPRAASDCYARAGDQVAADLYRCEVYHATELARGGPVLTRCP